MSGIIAATGFADSAFAQNFYKSFLANGRWELYVSGLGRTLEVTVLALLLGVILGVITALLRVAHDQRRPGRHSVGSVLLSICNAITRIYITVIRGTPAIVQLMILGFVVFKSSRNFTLVGALGLGINSGAYVSEIIRSGLMSIDKGQMEAGRSLGLNYMTTMVNVIIPQAIKNILPAEGHLPDLGHCRQGAALRGQGHFRQDLRLYVPAAGRVRGVPRHGHHLHLAAGYSGEEAESK